MSLQAYCKVYTNTQQCSTPSPDLQHTRDHRVPFGTDSRPYRSLHRLIDITMAPLETYRQQQKPRSDQLDQPPTFVTEQAFNATIEGLAQEMKEELSSIRNEFKNEFYTGAAISPTPRPTPQPQLHPKQPTRSAFTQPATQPITVQPAELDQRWSPEEIGYFNGSRDDVHAFTDRLTSFAELNTAKVIQANLVTLLTDRAFEWYHYELANETKWALNASTSIDPWCQALIRRFGPSRSNLIGQLEACRYTRKDASDKKDATVYIQDIMRVAKCLNWPQQDILLTAFYHFEPILQETIDLPSDLDSFMQQVQLRQKEWHQIYAGYDFRAPQPTRSSYPSLRPQQSYQLPRTQQPYHVSQQAGAQAHERDLDLHAVKSDEKQNEEGKTRKRNEVGIESRPQRTGADAIIPKGGRGRCGTGLDSSSGRERPKQVSQSKYNIGGTGKSKSGSKTREHSYRTPIPTPSRTPGEHQTASTKEGSASCVGVEEVQCIACRSDDVPVSQAAQLPCKHYWCNTCLRRIFDISTLDRQLMPPKCCTQECISLKHVEKLFGKSFKRRWNAKYREHIG